MTARVKLQDGPVGSGRPPDREGLLRALDEQKEEAFQLAKEQHASLNRSLNAIFDRMRAFLDADFSERCTDVVAFGSAPPMAEVHHTRQPSLPEGVDPLPQNPFDHASPDGSDDGSMISRFSEASEEFPMDLVFPQDQEPHGSLKDESRTGASQSRIGSPKDSNSKAMTVDSPIEHWLSHNPQEAVSAICNVKAYIDYVAGGLVLLNTTTMMLELQVEGVRLGEELGFLSTELKIDSMQTSLPALQALHLIFMFLFVAKWLLRLSVERWEFIRDYANWFDTSLVAVSLFDIYLTLAAVQNDGARQSVVILRLMRALKSMRAIRLVRSLRLFRGLRVLVKACTCFLPSLCWSMVLLGIFMSLGALMMGNLLQSYIEDEEQLLEDRQWIWLHYGTAYRAWYTLFEITFAGNWPTNVRPVLDKVSHVFVLFFGLYITVVVFAVIRVIGAIFLKETLDAAANDAEQLVKDRLRMKAEYVQKLESVFVAIDENGNGMITEQRLKEILSRPEIAAYFQTLDLDVHESAALFHLLDNGDGEVTLDEFIDGIMRCKGTARAIDQVAMHADLKQIEKKINKVTRLLKDLELVRGKSHTSVKRSPSAQANHLKVFRTDASVILTPGLRAL